MKTGGSRFLFAIFPAFLLLTIPVSDQGISGKPISPAQSLHRAIHQEAAHNVEVLSFLSGSAFLAGVHNGYSYIVAGDELQAIDCANPALPKPAGLPLALPPVFDPMPLKFQGDFAYLATRNWMAVLSLASPAAPVIVGNYPVADGYAIADMDVQGNNAFLVISTPWGNMVEIVDIHNPAAPTLAGTYFTAFHPESVTAMGDYIYLIGNLRSINIIDVSNISSPTQVTDLPFAQNAEDVAVSGNHAFVISGSDGLTVFDVSDPSRPALVAASPAVVGYQILLSGELAITGGNEIRLIDIHDPAAPAQVGMYGSNLGARIAGIYQNRIFATISSTELHIIDIANPGTPVLMGVYDSLGEPIAIEVEGDIAFISSGSGFLHVLDVTDPAAPFELSQINLNGRSSLAPYGGYLIVSNYAGGLIVLDVSDPAQHQPVGAAPTPGGSIAVSGQHAYIAAGEAGVIVVNLTNPSAPSQVGNYNPVGSVNGLKVDGSRAYIMIEDQGMDILDISNPASPTYLGSFQTAYSPWAIEAVGSIVYLADVQFAGYTTWLRAIDVSDSHNPTEVGVYHPASPGDYMVVTDLKFESNLLYMATYISQGTLLVLDVSNPSDPVLAGYDDRWSVAYALDAHKQIIYQAEIMGVTILRYTGSIPQNQFDLTVQSALPLQVLEYFDLVEDKPTAVKAVVCKSGSESVQHVPMQVKVGTTVISEFYVADKANTDENTGVLKSNNSAYPLNFGAGYGCKIVYFFGDRLTPTGNSFAVEVEVNPGGTIHELDRTNNTAVSDTLQVKKMSWGVLDPNLSFYYFRTDWAVNPNRTYENFYAEANSFIQAVYPVAPGQYHPVSLAGTRGDTSGSRGGDNHLSNIELNVWLMRTAVDMRLANPLADRYVAVVPEGWFAANTDYLTTPGIRNLMAGDLVLVEAGSSTRPNGTAYSTPAHEIGHSYGLPTGLPPFCGGEEYLDECHPGQISDGNPSGIGIWPGRRIPIGIADLPSFCFMSASELESYWVDPLDYAKLFNDHRSILSGQGPVSHTASPVLLASGTIHQNGVASLENWYTLPEGELTPLKPGPYTFEYQDSEGNVLHQVDFAIEFNMERAELDETGFVITLPLIPGTDKIQLKYNSLSVAQKTISANPPEVSITSPNDPGPFTQQMLVEWNGIDQDGDELTYTLLFSPDDGVTWEVIAGNMAATSSLWDLSGLAGGSQYLLKVIATDGFHSTQMVSESFSILQALHLPLILR